MIFIKIIRVYSFKTIIYLRTTNHIRLVASTTAWLSKPLHILSEKKYLQLVFS